MRLMYVFDPRQQRGYVCRVPSVVARLITAHAHRVGLCLDYAESEDGVS